MKKTITCYQTPSRAHHFTGRNGLRFVKPIVGIIILYPLLLASLTAQVVLNEVMADNRSAVENGNDYPDYVELYNPTSQAVELAGMSLSDTSAQPRLFVFPAGARIAARGYVVVWCDSNSGSPGWHSGFGLGARGERVRLYAANGTTVLDEVAYGLQVPNLSVGRIPNGTGNWTLTQPTLRAANVAQSLAAPTQLRINEWMARPAVGEDWIELYNSANLPVALGGLVFTDTTGGSPTNRAIRALSFIRGHGFLQFFASDLKQNDADHLDFKLGSNGETLSLLRADRSTVLDRVTFGAQVQDISQGRVPDGSDQIVDLPAGRATPGEPNYVQATGVVISEVLTHTDPPLEDAIELHNPTDTAVNISHWWLSDAASTPKKFRIPAGTILPPGGYCVFYEYQFGVGTTGFTFDSAEGDEVLLSAGDAAGNLTGQQVAVEFGPLKNGVSIGRHVTSAGVDFVPLNRRTFGVDNPTSNAQFRQGGGLSNAAPLVPPIVITEILFQPPAASADDEFIELHNPTAQAARLFDPLFPTNTWRLRNGVTFDFPRNLTIPAGGYLLLVGFDPETEESMLTAFRSKYGVPGHVPILGPFGSRLSDAGETLELHLPDEPQGPDKPNAGLVPYMMVEQISYAAAAPWPNGAAGTGNSLQRLGARKYGNEPLNWSVAAPTPGKAMAADGDQDGMPDAWETAHNLNPSAAADATGDADQDLASNLAEYLAGTDPQNALSVLKISHAHMENGSVNLSFPAITGRTYTVQCRENVGQGSWQWVTNLPPAATNTEIQIRIPAIGTATGFYRLAIQPTP